MQSKIEIIEIPYIEIKNNWRLSKVVELQEPIKMDIPPEGLQVLRTETGLLYIVLTPELLVQTTEQELKSDKIKTSLFKLQKEIYLKKQRDEIAAARLDLYNKKTEFEAKIQGYIDEIHELKKQINEVIGK